MDISVPTPVDFSFKRTVLSHGWYKLPPFALDRSRWILTRVLDLNENRPVTISISHHERSLIVGIKRKSSKPSISQLIRDVRHMLRLDDDMAEFYRAMRADTRFEWIARSGAGRLLRSPTVYEDLVKTICTTNCSWALTEKMVHGLVNYLGRETEGGRRAFPTPQAMAEAPAMFYRDVVRAGYRAPYLKELAEQVAGGALDVESWLTSELDTTQLKKEMKRVKGVGDYAAENLLKLIGRYDVLALDSWVRAKFAQTRGPRKGACDDKRIARFYAPFRSWRGLALWCDMTRDWLDE